MSEQHKVNCTCDVCTSGSNYRPVRVRREEPRYRQVPVIHRIYPVPIRDHLRQGDRILLRCQPRPHLRAQPRSQAQQQPGVNPGAQPQDEPMEEAVASINELCRTVKIVTRIAPGDVIMAEASAKKPEGAGEKGDCDSCSNNNTCGPHEMRARPVEPVAGSSMAKSAPKQESSTDTESSQEEMIE